MRCHESARVGRLADDDLDAVERRVVERHLQTCTACTHELGQTLDLRHALGDEALRFALPATLRERGAARGARRDGG